MNYWIKQNIDSWSVIIIAQNILQWLLCITYFTVLSKLPVTKRFMSEIQAISLMGASCVATVIVWLLAKDHILACLSQPPEKTVIPSSFQVEHKAYIDNHISVCMQIQDSYFLKLLTSLNKLPTQKKKRK